MATRQNLIVPFTGLGQSPAQLLVLVLGAVWALSRLRGGRGAAGVLGWRVAVGASVLAADVSYVAGMTQDLAVEQIASSDKALLTRLTAAGFAVLVVEVVRTARQLELILGAVVWAGVVSALAGLAQFATGVDVAALLKLPGLRALDSAVSTTVLRSGYARAQGSASVPLEFGAVVTVLVPVAVALAVAARRRGDRAWPWALAAIVLTAGGAVSLSRSVFVGLAVALVVLASRWPLKVVGGVLAGIVAFVGVAYLLASRVVGDLVVLLTQGAQDYSLASRSAGRHYVGTQVLSHLWFGQGLGTYQTGVQPVLDNQYLSELVESGLVGVSALAALLLVAFVTARRARAVHPDPAAAEVLAGISAAVAVAAVVDLVLDTSGFPQIFLLDWLVVGLAGAAGQLAVEARRQAGPSAVAVGDPHVRVPDRPGRA